MSEEIPKAPLLVDIESIDRSVWGDPSSWKKLEMLIEMPLRAAMHDFWEKGVSSWQVSCSQKNITSREIFFEIRAGKFLSDENNRSALAAGAQLIQRGDHLFYQFRKTVDSRTECETLVTWSRAIAATFSKQEKSIKTA